MAATASAQAPRRDPPAAAPSELRTVRVSRAPELDDFTGRAATRKTGVHKSLDAALGAGEGDVSVVGDEMMRRPDTTGLAWVTDFRQREPGDGTPVSQPTAAFIAYDNSNLYVVFVCKDNPSQIRAGLGRREELSEDDKVVLYLDTFKDGKRAYVFEANARGVQKDAIRTEGLGDDDTWDTVWYTDGRFTPDGYVVRMTIPFRSLRFPRAPVQSWGIGLSRTIRRESEESFWPLISKRKRGIVPQLGVLNGLADISPGRNIQFDPYSTVDRGRYLNSDVPAFQNTGDQRVGVDAKIVVHDAITIDATVNPDFSQVESDDPKTTANSRFEEDYPEKRPFFFENAGYFVTPVNLFYTRRIADPGYGLRLTGRDGPWAIGAIGIDDRAPTEVESPSDPGFGRRAGVWAVRLQRELPNESGIGMLVSDREFAGSYSRTSSLDTRLTFGKNWAFTAQAIATDTRLLDSTRLQGPGYFASIERNGRTVDYLGTYLDLSSAFDPQLGFIERVGMRQTEHLFSYRFRLGKGLITKFGPDFTALYIWDRDNIATDRSIEPKFVVEMRGETVLELSRAWEYEVFEGLPFRPWSNSVSFETKALRWLAFKSKIKWGGSVNHKPLKKAPAFLGEKRSADVEFTFRPWSRLRLDQAILYTRLNVVPSWGQNLVTAVTPVFEETHLRSKVNYQFSPRFSLRTIFDWSATSPTSSLTRIDRERNWAMDFLLTYLVNPGTAVYMGYTDLYENTALVTDPTTGERDVVPTDRARTPVGRRWFMKISYLWRW